MLAILTPPRELSTFAGGRYHNVYYLKRLIAGVRHTKLRDQVWGGSSDSIGGSLNLKVLSKY